MIIKLVQNEDEEVSSPEKELFEIKQKLKDQYPCYVLITCDSAKNTGEIDVEMSYEGDEDLAALITENATKIFEGRVPRRERK